MGTNVKKVVRNILCVAGVIILLVLSCIGACILNVTKSTSMKIEPILIGNMVASYEYIDREVNIDYFYNLDGNTTYEEIQNEIGKPNGAMSSGITTPYYQVGNQYVVIWFARDVDGKYTNILRIGLYTKEAYVEDIPLK